MKKEEKVKLEIIKLEKERNEGMIFYLGMLAAYISIIIPVMINSKKETLLITAGIFIVVLIIMSLFYLNWYKKRDDKIDLLYKELKIK